MAVWTEASAVRMGLDGEQAGDWCGSSAGMADDGSVALLGAIGADGNATDSGAAMLMTRTGGAWHSLLLAPANGQRGDRYGHASAVAGLGNLVAVSAPFAARDGLTTAGTVYLYTRSGASWTESEIAPPAREAGATFGSALAVAADGASLLVGAGGEQGGRGAAYLYQRNGSGGFDITRFAASDAAAADRYGWAGVALSRDGNTVVVGAPRADMPGIDGTVLDAGAVYVYRRGAGGAWQETKLAAATPFLRDMLGQAVAVSDDGNTILAGAPGGSDSRGRAIAFRWTGSEWSATVITASQRLQDANFGGHLALSADGMVAAIAAPGESVNGRDYAGAVYVYRWGGASWQQVTRMVAPDGAENAFFGSGLAFSADGTQLLLGSQGWGLGQEGAAYTVAARRGVAGDADNDTDADLLWTGPGNAVALWRLQGTALAGTSTLLSSAAGTGFVPLATGDFDGDGRTDILWRHTSTGAMSMTLLGASGSTPTARAVAVAWSYRQPTSWVAAAVTDFGVDGRADILWRDTTTGALELWTMGAQVRLGVTSVAQPGTSWHLLGAADIDGDHRPDLLWRHNDGRVAAWLMQGATFEAGAVLDRVGSEWTLAALADFDGDGKADMLWRRGSDGQLALWRLNGLAAPDGAMIASAPPVWQVVGAADATEDGKADILWRNTADGRIALWAMDGPTRLAATVLGTAGSDWNPAAVGLAGAV